MDTPRHGRDDLPPPLEATAGALAVQVAGLREELAAQGELFTRGIKQLDKRKGSRLAVLGSYALWIIDIVLIAFLVVLLMQVVTGVKEQCNTLDLFLGLHSDAARVRFEKGPEAYDTAYGRLRGSYERLDCAHR